MELGRDAAGVAASLQLHLVCPRRLSFDGCLTRAGALEMLAAVAQALDAPSVCPRYTS